MNIVAEFDLKKFSFKTKEGKLVVYDKGYRLANYIYPTTTSIGGGK